MQLAVLEVKHSFRKQSGSKTRNLNWYLCQCLVDRVKEKECGSVSLVMEHFNLSQQPLLDSYLAGELTPGGLLSGYQEGEEGHDISRYEPLLHYARPGDDIKTRLPSEQLVGLDKAPAPIPVLGSEDEFFKYFGTC